MLEYLVDLHRASVGHWASRSLGLLNDLGGMFTFVRLALPLAGIYLQVHRICCILGTDLSKLTQHSSCGTIQHG